MSKLHGEGTLFSSAASFGFMKDTEGSAVGRWRRACAVQGGVQLFGCHAEIILLLKGIKCEILNSINNAVSHPTK